MRFLVYKRDPAGPRNRHDKTRAFAVRNGAFDFQAPSIFFQASRDDGQAESSAASFGGEKWLQDFFPQGRRNARAVVAEGQDTGILRNGERQENLSTRGDRFEARQ